MSNQPEFLGEDDDGFRFDLGQDVHFVIEAVDGKSVLSFVQPESDGSETLLHSTVESRDWHTNKNLVGQLGNKLDRKHGLGSVWVKTQLEHIKTFIQAADEELRQRILSPGAARISAQTSRVEYTKKGGDTEYVVHLTKPPEETDDGEFVVPDGGDLNQIVFTVDEWNADNPKPLMNKYLNQFPKDRVTLTEDEWRELRRQWEDELEEGYIDTYTTEEQIASSVVEHLRKVNPLPPEDRELVLNDDYNALYEYDNDEWGSDVLWVRNQAVMDALEQKSNKTEDYMKVLSGTLHDGLGVTFDSPRSKSIAGNPGNRMYPFDPESVNVDRITVEKKQEEDEEGVGYDE